MQLLFLHGFATGPRVWQFQVEEFLKKFEVITEAELISGDVVVVGWSMGGWKAMELSLEQPRRVIGLVLVSAFAKYLRSPDYPFGTSPALLRKLEKKFKADFRNGLKYFYQLVFKDEKWNYLIDQLPVPREDDINRWFEKLKKEDFRDRLSEIKIPTLIIHGKQDEIVPWQASEYLRENIENSEIFLLEKVGHAPMVEVPGIFNQVLMRFLNNVG